MVVVLVPLKPLARAKSRLGLPAGVRGELVLAMALDVLAAVAAVSTVSAVAVISSDPAARGLGVPVVDDPGGGLDAAVLRGAAGVTGRVAVLHADLPALRAGELAAALEAAAPHRRALVADAPGTGTVLLAAATGARLRPSFGLGSRRRHTDLGARDLTAGLDVPGLRRDVDTLLDLRQAAALGVGAATARLLPVVAASGPSPDVTEVTPRSA